LADKCKIQSVPKIEKSSEENIFCIITFGYFDNLSKLLFISFKKNIKIDKTSRVFINEGNKVLKSKRYNTTWTPNVTLNDREKKTTS